MNYSNSLILLFLRFLFVFFTIKVLKNHPSSFANMAAASKKQALCDLWGISSSEIDVKICSLKSIIGDLPSTTLLDYLTKCDLNLDQCINLHFTQSAINMTVHDANTHSSNHNNHNNASNESNPLSKPLQKRKRQTWRKRLKKISKKQTWRKRRKTIPKKQTKNGSNNEDSTDSDYVPEKSKKRKFRSKTDDPSQPQSKKRRLSSAASANTTTTNSNSNSNSSSSKQERDDDDDDKKEETKNANDNKKGFIPPLDSNYWNKLNQLTFGSFSFESKPKHNTKSLTLQGVANAYKKGKFKANLVDDEWFNIRSKTLRNLIHTALQEMFETIGGYHQGVVVQNTMKEEGKNPVTLSDYHMMIYKKNTKYIQTFNLSLQCKPQITMASEYHDVVLGAAIGLCTRNKEIFIQQLEANQLHTEYEKKCSKRLTLEGLLDFACKYKYDVTPQHRRDEEDYGLAVKLYDYQVQSIHYMIEEENHKIGFYRHLYRLGYFEGDESKPFFYYSAVFQHLIINQHLPIVHGGFLCEEMGLGKTIEAMALINYNQRTKNEDCSTRETLIVAHTIKKQIWKEFHVVEQEIKYYKSRATLIIAPVSLVGQWEKECVEKSRRKIAFKRYYASYRKRDVRLYIDQDIVFTTYGIIGKENGSDRQKHVLHCIEWHRIILDESHYIKNRNTLTSKNMMELRGVNKWLLTGTPFGRQVHDIYNQLKFLGVQGEHLDSFVNWAQMKRFNSIKSAVPLLKIMQDLVMRHKKAQLFNDEEIVRMTSKQEDVMFIEFSGSEQKEYYDKLYSIAKQRYEVYKATGNIGRGSIAILASLHPARQACSGHIYSAQEIEEELSKAQAKTYHVQQMVHHNGDKSAQELYDMALASAYNMDDAECPICYETPFDEPLQTICRHIFCGECIRSVLIVKPECPMCRKKCSVHQLKKPPSATATATGTNEKEMEKKEEEEEESGGGRMIRFDTKLKRLIEQIKRLKRDKPQDKSLIFTSFSKSLNWICDELRGNGIEYRTLTGSMSMNKRKKALQEFEADDNVKVFVLTVRSGAVGITLTAANHVFLMEPPFNPALYRQAINRVHRLGQKKKVFIQTLIMKNSIEEKIWNVNKEKQSVDGAMAGNISRDKSVKLQTHEISKLFE
eukprot:550072_1